MPSKKNRKSAVVAETFGEVAPAENTETPAVIAAPRGRGRPESQIPNPLKFAEAVKEWQAGRAALPTWISHIYPVVDNGMLASPEMFVTAPYFRVSADGQTARLVRLVKQVGGKVTEEMIKTVNATVD